LSNSTCTATRWQLRAKRPIVSSAALAPGGIVYIGADTALYALNTASGSGKGAGEGTF
jgi:hypothetical protein